MPADQRSDMSFLRLRAVRDADGTAGVPRRQRARRPGVPSSSRELRAGRAPSGRESSFCSDLLRRCLMLPDGDTLLVSTSTGARVGADRWDHGQIVAYSVKSRIRKVLIEGGSNPRYLPTGHLAYAVGGSVYAMAFDRADADGQRRTVSDHRRRASLVDRRHRDGRLQRVREWHARLRSRADDNLKRRRAGCQGIGGEAGHAVAPEAAARSVFGCSRQPRRN